MVLALGGEALETAGLEPEVLDDVLGLADELGGESFELLFEAARDADDGVGALVVKPENMSLAIHKANVRGTWRNEWKTGGSRLFA